MTWRRFRLGLWPGMALSAADTVLLRGKAPWTLHHRYATSTPTTVPPQWTCWPDHPLLDTMMSWLHQQTEGYKLLLTPEAWRRHADHEALQPASSYAPRDYPAPDSKISFSLNDSLYRSGTNHDHDQPPHLRLRNAGLPSSLNWPVYAGPESRYCPAGAPPRLASVCCVVALIPACDLV